MSEPVSPSTPPQSRKRPQRKRDKLIQVRVSVAELAEVAEAADRVGLTLASYARQRLLGHTPARAVRRPPVDRVLVAQLLAALGPIATDVRALVRTAASGAADRHGNEEGSTATAEAALTVLAEIRDLAMRALRREP